MGRGEGESNSLILNANWNKSAAASGHLPIRLRGTSASRDDLFPEGDGRQFHRAVEQVGKREDQGPGTQTEAVQDQGREDMTAKESSNYFGYLA